MSNLAISARDISKRYRLGVQKTPASTMIGRVAQTAVSPFDWLTAQVRGISEKETLWALKDVSFDVKWGEVVGIIGSNGAGKSTLLKILSRITEPTGGEADIHGRLAALLEVGTGMHPELTGRENIFLNGCILGMKKAEVRAKFDEIVAFSGIEKFIDTQVKRYSSGMRVRLGFAIAAHLESDILVVDEVLAVGDATFQKQCLGKMKDVAGHGRTVLFVSHNMGAVRSLCTRAIHLEEGAILKSGDVDRIVDGYLSHGGEDILHQQWSSWETSPGNDQVRIAALDMEFPGKTEGLPIYTNTPITVRYRFWNLKESQQLNINSRLMNTSGEIVFPVWSEKTVLPKGLIEGVLKLPGDLLNDGMYTLDLNLVSNGRSVFIMDNAFRFHVHDMRDDSVEWFGKVRGAIRPVFLRFPLKKVGGM